MTTNEQMNKAFDYLESKEPQKRQNQLTSEAKWFLIGFVLGGTYVAIFFVLFGRC